MTFGSDPSNGRNMPIFHFHTADGMSVETECSSVQAAKCEAARYAGRIICDEPEKFWDSSDFFLAVSDERGLMLFTFEAFGHDSPAIRIGEVHAA
jgi:hypothetical protein